MIQTTPIPARPKSTAVLALLCATFLLSVALVGRAGATAPTDYDVTVHSDPSYQFDKPGSSVVADGHLFVANEGTGTLTQISSTTGAFERVITGVTKPSFITAYDGKVWVTSYDTNTIYVVDIASGTVTQTLTDATFSCPSGIVAAGGKLWVAQNCAARVSIINPDGTIADTLSGGSYSFSWPFIISTDGEHVWVPNTGSTAVTKLNLTPTAGSYLDAVYTNSTTPGAGFSGLRQTLSDGVWFWTINNSAGTITQMEVATGALVRVLSGSEYEFNGFGLAVLYDDYLWVPALNSNQVTVISKADGGVVTILKGSPYDFSRPASSAYGDGSVWFPNFNNNTLTELRNLSVPTAPQNVTASATSGSATITWEAPASDGRSPITDYVVSAEPGGASCTTTELSCEITGLTDGTSYVFSVVATNAIGSSPAASSASTLIPADTVDPIDEPTDGPTVDQVVPTYAG